MQKGTVGVPTETMSPARHGRNSDDMLKADKLVNAPAATEIASC
jgi:hypothetical protein